MHVAFRFGLGDAVKTVQTPADKSIKTRNGEVVALEVSRKGTLAVIKDNDGRMFRELECNLNSM